MYEPSYYNGWNSVVPNGMFCEAALTNAIALNYLNAMTCQSIQSSMANTTNNLHAMTQQGILSPQECRDMTILYADNQPIQIVSPLELARQQQMQAMYQQTVCAFKKYKPRLTIYDLDKLIFPDDPIRDWVEKKTAEINKKFAWADELMERMDI